MGKECRLGMGKECIAVVSPMIYGKVRAWNVDTLNEVMVCKPFQKCMQIMSILVVGGSAGRGCPSPEAMGFSGVVVSLEDFFMVGRSSRNVPLFFFFLVMTGK